MMTSVPPIEGAYVRDLFEQPAALRRANLLAMPGDLIHIAGALRAPRASIVLTGMGSSFHALHPIAIRLAESGLRITMLETSELIYFWPHLLGKDTVVLAVSQSGRSAEMIRLLEVDDGRSTLIAVTNDAASPLAQAAHALALMNAGPESTVSCKTYLCTLLLLDRIADVLCGRNWQGDPERSETSIAAVDSYLSHWREHIDEAQHHLQGIHHIVFAGRGPSLAAAHTGALIIKESARFPAEGMSSAAFRHGPLEMISKRMLLVVFAGDQRSSLLNARLAEDVNRLGGAAQLVSDAASLGLFRLPAIHPGLQPLLEMLPAQMISLALAARESREAGSFLRATKITTTE